MYVCMYVSMCICKYIFIYQGTRASNGICRVCPSAYVGSVPYIYQGTHASNGDEGDTRGL